MGNEASTTAEGPAISQDTLGKVRGVIVMELPDSDPSEMIANKDCVEMVVPCQDGLDRVDVEITLPGMTQGEPVESYSRTTPPAVRAAEEDRTGETVELMDEDEVGYLRFLPSLHPKLTSAKTLNHLLSQKTSGETRRPSNGIVDSKERDKLITIISY